jgi:type II secretory pathway pseudopilin PulG
MTKTIETANSRQRPGISLIEVLFAMGILSVGILAMAALLPLGVYELGESDKLDQTSTLGRAAFRDLEVRGYLQPKMWVDTQVGMLVAPVLSPDPDPNRLTGPTPNGSAANPAPGQRLVTYQYVPPACSRLLGQLFGQSVPSQFQIGSPPNCPSLANQPQLFSQPFTYTYLGNPTTPPIGLNTPTGTPLMPVINDIALRSVSGYTAIHPTYPAVPPFMATESPLVVLDPLMVGAMGLKYLSTQPPYSVPTGTATVPPIGSAPNVWTNIQTFPYQQTYVPGAPIIPRLTLLQSPLPQFSISGSPPSAVSQPPTWPLPWFEGDWLHPRFMPFAAADRIFRAADDIAFNPLDPTDRTRDRPTRSMNYDSGISQPLPPQVQYQGSYSWFVMIAPSLGESDSTASDMAVDPVLLPDTNALSGTRQFTASVVVCQNRVLDVPATFTTSDPKAPLPGEWMVPALVTGGGIGGGEVQLIAADKAHVNWLGGLRPGSWLMLSGLTVSAEIRMDPDSSSWVYWPKFKPVAEWYRIVAVDDGSGLTSAAPYLNVTLAGTDWPQPPAPTWPINFGTIQANYLTTPGVQFVDLNSMYGQNIYTYATIIDGVVGVYQKTISFDGDSLFAPH